MNKRCESLFINLQRGECVRQIRPRDTRIKALSCSNWVQFQTIFFCAMKKYDLGSWEEQLPSGYWPFHKIKPLQFELILYLCNLLSEALMFRSGSNALYYIRHSHLHKAVIIHTLVYIFSSLK